MLKNIYVVMLCLSVGLSHDIVFADDPANIVDDDPYGDEFGDQGPEGDWPAGWEEEQVIADPFEPINRVTFWVNDKLYFYALKPIARVYRVVPERARVSVSNFFFNITTPVRVVNQTLQAKFKDAGKSIIRFVVNTTVGIGGLFDPAKRYLGLEKKDEDTGQTLGYYGAGPGFYIVLPILGPSNLRDGIGRVADIAMNPVYHILDEKDFYAAKGIDIVNNLSLDRDTYETIKEQSLDPYLFLRDAYTQRRQGKIDQ